MPSLAPRARNRPGTFRSFSVRNFRLFAIGNFTSVTGTWMQLVAQNWLVLHLTGSTALLGVTVMLQAVPTAVLGLAGGAIADRASRRRLLAIVQCIWITLTLALALLVATGAIRLWMLLVAAVVGGLISAIEGPTNAAFGPELVDADDLPNAIALGSAITSAGRVLGMALAGVVVALAGTSTVFFVNAASFAGVLGALALIRPGELRRSEWRSATQPRTSIRDGLRFVRDEPVVRSTVALACCLSLFGRNYQVTTAAMVKGPLHAGAAGYGIASTAFAIGGVLGALFAARFAHPTRVLLVLAGLVTGVLQLGAGAAPGLGQYVAAVIPIAAGAVLIDTLTGSLTQVAASDEMRGRVAAVLALATVGGAAIGGPLLGWVADAFGARIALWCGGGAVLMSVVTATVRYLHPRRADLTAAVVLSMTRRGIGMSSRESTDATAAA
jgi:MFS family permease